MNVNRVLFKFAASIALYTVASQCVFSRQDPIRYNWPQVQPLHEEFNFPDALRARVDLTMRGVSGKALYELHCRPGALILEPGKAITLPHDPVFWGDFDCHVHSLYTRDYYESLLIEDPLDNDASRSRGEFYFYELQGSCPEYPEWGRTRSFRFRGMHLRLELFDIHFAADPAPGRLASFGFKVDVIPDPLALSAISEPPAFADPAFNTGNPRQHAFECDRPVEQHVAGAVTEGYVRAMGLSSPYSVVGSMTKKLKIDTSRSGNVIPPSGKLETRPMEHFATFQINDQDGKPAYTFECVAYRVVGEKTPQIAGDGLTCGLFLPGKKTNLLLDSVDPYSRMSPAVILPNQLHGAAGNEPEWGNTRHFSLRGLSLTFTFANSVLGKDEFGNFTLLSSDLTIECKSDPDAQTPVAKAPSSSFVGHFDDFGIGRVQ